MSLQEEADRLKQILGNPSISEKFFNEILRRYRELMKSDR